MRTSVFAGRSVLIALATGLVVALTFGGLVGAQWRLAGMNGFVAGALALGFAFAVRNAQFRRRTQIGKPSSWAGVWLLFMLVAIVPSSVAHSVEWGIADRFALQGMILLIGFASFQMGLITATLDHTERVDGDATDEGIGPGHPPPPKPGHGSTSR